MNLPESPMTISLYAIPGKLSQTDVNALPKELNELYGIEKSINKTRKTLPVVARQIGMALAYLFSDKTLKQVGYMYNKDHSTVMHSINAITKAVETNDGLVMDKLDPLFRRYYDQHINNIRVYKSLSKEKRELTKVICTKLEKYKIIASIAKKERT